jgi:hypothetical protein
MKAVKKQILRTNPVQNQSQNELATKSVRNSGQSRPVRTNSVRKLQSITEENLSHTDGTTIDRIPVTVPILAPILWSHFLKGRFSLKN